MEQQILDAPVDVQNKLNFAGFWIRVVAYLIDGVTLWVVNLIIAFAFFGGYSFTEPNLGLSLFSMLIGIAYFTGMESSFRQATLGKMAVGIRVGDEQGEQITFGNALGRYFAKILSALILCIGFMMAGWDEKKQGLHDKLASTYVFYK
jgi:uncharacterized RDD family membrane protein YckC